MKYLKSFLFGFLILSNNSEMFAQDALNHKSIFQGGITLE